MNLKQSIAEMADSKMFSKNMKRMRNLKKVHSGDGSVQMKLSLTEPAPPSGITRTALFASRRADAHRTAEARLSTSYEKRYPHMFVKSARG